MQRLHLSSSVLFAAALLATPVVAGDPDVYPVGTAAIEGDSVAGVGLVSSIGNIVVNNNGDWLVEVDTDNADTDADGALLDGGGLLQREGGALAAPVGATLDSFDAVTLNDNGSGGFNHFLDGTTGSTDDSGVYLDGALIIQESDVSTAAGLSAGTPYRGFFEVKINDSDALLIMASVDDPAIASTTDRALVVATTAAGALTGETVVAKEGDLLPGQTELVADFETGPHNFAFNDAGQVMFIADLEGGTAVDHAVYIDGTLVAQEGFVSPVGGREWSSLSLAELDLNNNGDYILSGSLAGDAATNLLISVNGAKFVQEGDSMPAIPGFSLTSFGSGPVHIADNGTKLWYGDWDDPDTSRDTGLFLNDQLVVQEGVTAIAGSTVLALRGIQDGYDPSEDGTWMIFEAALADGREGAFTIEIGPWTSRGNGLAGTGGVTPCLTGVGPLSVLSANSLELHTAAPSALMAYVVGVSEVNVPFFGGTLVPAPDVVRLFGTNALGELSLPYAVPATVFPGTPLIVQGWITDAGAFGGYSATNAIAGVVAP